MLAKCPVPKCPKPIIHLDNAKAVRKYLDRFKICLGSDENWKVPETEIQEHFKIFPHRTEPITRGAINDKKLYDEMSQTYFAKKNYVDRSFHDETEYKDNYSDVEIVKVEVEWLKSDFPLHDKETITFYNPNGAKPSPFRRKSMVTRSHLNNYDVQFG